MSSGDDRACHPIGRDEMNLAEFPITLLADRVPKGVKTLVFEDPHGTLTITGSDAYGLPTAPDADVIVALLALTKARNDFTDPTVPFTRYEILDLLGWPDKGRSYHRLDESLRRWVGVTLRYDGAWWDASLKCRVDALFHILDCVTIFDDGVRRTLRGRGQPVPPSTLTWSKTFFQSCRADNLKRLDLSVYRSLGSAVSRQLFRFLDKRFHAGKHWTFDLAELAFDRVGLSRNYTPAKAKEKLRPAIAELEAIGFIEPMPNSERFTPGGRRGEWRVRFARKATPTIEAPPQPPPDGLEAELVALGVTRAIAAELVRDFPEEVIREKVAHVEWSQARGRSRKIGAPAAYLVASIRGDYAPPAGYRSRAEADQAMRTEAEARAAKARERAEDAQIKAFLDGLSEAERDRVDAAALAAAAPEVRAAYEAEPKPLMRRLLLVPIREAHLRRMLGL